MKSKIGFRCAILSNGDESSFTKGLKKEFKNWEFIVLPTLEQYEQTDAREPFDLVISNANLLQVENSVRIRSSFIVVYDSMDTRTAVVWMKAGAKDCLPSNDMQGLTVALHREFSTIASKTNGTRDIWQAADYQEIIDAVEDIMLVVDRDSVILAANRAAERFTNRMTSGKLVGANIGKSLRFITGDYVAKIANVYRSGERLESTDECEYDGNRMVFSSALIPIKIDNNTAAVLIIATDVSTETQNAEFYRRESNYRELRSELWEMENQLSELDEDKLIRTILEIIGKRVQASRVCYLTLNEKEEFELHQEWLNVNAKPSALGTKIPKPIWKLLIHLDILELSPRSMQELIKRYPLLKPFEHIILDIFKREGIFNILFFPLKLRGNPEAVVSFDWCEDTPKDWTESEVHIGLEAVKIIGSNIRQKRILDELNAKDQRLKLAVDTTRQGFWDWDYSTQSFYYSPVNFEILGYEAGEFEWNLDTLRKMLHPDDVSEAISSLEDFFAGKTASDELTSEYRVKTKNQGWIWVYSRSRIIAKNDEGMPIRIVGTLFDITKRKEAEEMLRKSEQYYFDILTSLPHAIQQHDLTGKIIFSNPAKHRLLGYENGELIGKNVLENFSPEYSRQDLLAENARVIKERPEPGTLIFNLVKKDGTIIIVEVEWTYFYDRSGQLAGFIYVDTDVTERFRAEEALRESEQRFKLAMDASNEGLWDLNIRTEKFLLSDRYYQILGYEPNEFEPTYSALMDLVHPEDLSDFTNLRESYLLGEIDHHEFEFRMLHKEQQYVWILSRGKVVERDENGRAVRLIGTHSDITPLKIMQQKMIAETELLLVTLRSIGEGMIATDRNGHVMVMNSLAEKLTGWKAQDAIGKHLHKIYRIVSEESHDTVEDPVGKIMQLGKEYSFESQVILVAADDSERFVDQNVSPILDPGGNVFGVVIIFRDITDQKRIDEYIRMKDRFDAMGVLAGSIAHDFNNYLTVLLGNISILKYYVKDEAQSGILNDSENAAMIAKQLTQQLMNFARAGEPIKKVGSVEQPLRNSISLCFSATNTEINLTIAPDLMNVDMDESQISQAFSNIFINAVQAMQGGGRIWINVENADGSEMPKEILPEDYYIKIMIRDEGEGIPEKYLDKIFDPFFTTKDKGTGLGLASVFSIIKRHKGYVTVDSEVGKGAAFIIYLPALRDYHKQEEKPRFVDERFEMKTLLMDDDQMILTVGKRLLEYLGCEAVTVANGEEAVAAIESAKNSGSPFDVAFLDLNVPSGSGALTTVTKAKQTDPGIKVVLVTAMTNHPQVKAYKEAGFDEIMTKPFSLDDLKNVLTGLKGYE